MAQAVEEGLSPAPDSRAQRSIAILYGTETGNSEEVAGELGKMAQRLHFETTVEEMNAFALGDLVRFSLLIFVTSTTGQGDMPQNATGLWKSLLRKKLRPTSLGSVRFTTFGLGDSSYPKFNWAARKLQRRLLQLGATEFFRSGEGDERHDDGIDSIFIPWHQDLRASLLSLFPLPATVEPIPDEVQLPPKLVLRFASSDAPLEESREPSPHTLADTPPGDMLPIPDTFVAQVVSNSRVTPGDHWQDVRLIKFKIAQGENLATLPDLLPGSTLIVYPKNYPRDVQALIELMGWDAVADRPLEWAPPPGSCQTRLSGAAGRGKLHAQKGATLRELLTHNLDFNSVPGRGFVREAAGLATSDMEQERLRELVQAGNAQDLYDYTTRPRRTILELLADFPSVRIPLERALDVLPPIRGREFSIANGGASLGRGDERGAALTVDVLAALVEYRTIIRKPRRGLCSRYLDRLPAGASVRVGLKIAPSGPPCDATSAAGQPLIAIAAGTGVAPIRSLIQQRAHAATAMAPSLLFFGCRNERADYYFRDEWEATAGLRVVPAFSRDAGSNGGCYVQDQIQRHAGEVAELVGRGALVCVCGSSGRMPAAVKEALLDSLVLGGLVEGRTEAEAFWPKVAFWQETW